MSLRRFVFILSAVMVLQAAPSFAADELCPEADPENARALPGDVSGVQSDIERLNLCVERAKLLKQLDDIAKQRGDILKKITSPGMDIAPGVGGVGGIPPMPANSLPSLPTDISGLKDGSMPIRNAAGSPFNDAAAAVKSAVSEKAWKVRKIWGQGADMQAQLSDGSGTLLNVKRGDLLPDGRTVDSVSIRGVAASQNGKITDLSWDNASDSVDAGNAVKNNAVKTNP